MEKPDVVCLTEMWFSPYVTESEWSTPGDVCLWCDQNIHGGGVALYISVKLDFQLTTCGPIGLDFILVLVHYIYVKYVHCRLYIEIWWQPTNHTALDDL